MRSYGLLGSPPDESFDRIARLAARTLNVPTAAIVLVDATRQWVIGRHGLDVAELPRDSFCDLALDGDRPLVTAGAAPDETLGPDPPAGVARFHAAAPLAGKDGTRLGLLSVMDGVARPDLDPARLEPLAELAGIAMEALEMRRLVKAGSEAGRAKSEFLAVMSHELRTPLNAVIGFSELMQQEVAGPLGSPKYGEYLRHIRDGGRHLMALIDNVLSLSAAETGELVLTERRFDIGRAIRQCVALCSDALAEKKLAVQLAIAPDLPFLLADRARTLRMIGSLLDNAMKFSPAGRQITIRAGLTPAQGLEIAVCDQGIGMRAEDLARVTAPFNQVESALTRSHGGCGLGLPLVRRLIERHGGRLVMASQPRGGTTASLLFPASRVTALHLSPPAAAPGDPG